MYIVGRVSSKPANVVGCTHVEVTSIAYHHGVMLESFYLLAVPNFKSKLVLVNKNSGEVLNKLKYRGFRATSLSTYDFSTLYTTLPHTGAFTY